MAARSIAACWRACCTTMGPKLRTRKMEDTTAAASSDSQHTASEGYRHSSCGKIRKYWIFD